jgi:hypothetical protein
MLHHRRMIPCVRYSLEDSNTVSLKFPYPMMLIIVTRISLQHTQLPKSFNYDRQSAGGVCGHCASTGADSKAPHESS